MDLNFRKMKKLIIYGLGLVLFLSFQSCEEYIRTEVVKELYVNKSIINGFVGEEVQLIASPTDGSYQFKWSSEDEKIATVSQDGKVKLTGEGFTNIIVEAGDIKQKVEIYSVIRISLEDIVLSDTNLEMTPGEKKIITVQRVPDNANDIPSAVWSTENSAVVVVNELGEITGVGEGQTSILYTVGPIVKKVNVAVTYTSPFNGPHILQTGKQTEIMAADFDYGGLGYAFNDDEGNNIGNDDYRRSKGDSKSKPVEVEGNGNNIGYINAGDWYQYTVDVKEAGKYLFDASLSANGDGSFHLEVDGVRVPGDIQVPNNGSWNSWRYIPTTPIEINLTEGKHKIKFVVDKSGFNLRAIRFSK